MYFWEEEAFVEIKGKKICFGCAVHVPHEHSCFGNVSGEACECDYLECQIRQKRITLEEANEIISKELQKEAGIRKK